MGDGSVLRGDTAELTRVSELLRGADDLRAGLKDTDDEVSAMLAEWRGDSGGAYENAWRLWHQGADRIQSGLSLTAVLLGQASTAYEHQEASSAEALRGIAE
jgi:WXG100 family type VII secretion target